MPVVEVAGLHKGFRRRGARGLLSSQRLPALAGLDLVVDEGGVHGFLGPNGSGKTTTLRTLLGLIRPDAGDVRLFGQTVPDALPRTISEVGALIETPQFFPTFSGHRNLGLLAAVAELPRARVDEVLETVGLADRAHDNVKTYSLGMRQRLGIAAVLLKAPRLLVLDEPTNGLDPAGIREIRELLRELGRSGHTVLLSSHLLAEVQQVCDSVTIVNRGRTVTSGHVADVLADHQVAGTVRVGLADLAAGAEVLAGSGFSVSREPESLLVSGVDDPAAITRALAGHGLYVAELSVVRRDLEDVFLELTEGAA